VAITFFGVATTPTDNSAQAGPTVAVTPPASMVKADLVLLHAVYRDSAATLNMSELSGQKWNALAQYNTTNVRARLFWCQFTGAWGSNPSATVGSGTNNMNVQMIVFRPNSTANLGWTVDVAQVSATYAAPSTPFTVTITAGATPRHPHSVTLGVWNSVDDNTWDTLSGSGWSKTSLGAQYRNNSTNDNSSTYAYNIKSSASSIANVSQNQATLGGDAGSTMIVTFSEQKVLPYFTMIPDVPLRM
jgi:hypothetical protein